MAHTYDTSESSGVRYFENPVNFSYTCGTGATLLVVMISHTQVSRTGGAPTYNGVALTQVGSEVLNLQEVGSEMWYMVDPPTGSAYTISVPNGEVDTIQAIAASFKAAAGYTSQLFDHTSTDKDVANPSLTINSVPAGSVVIDILSDGASDVPSARSHTLISNWDYGLYVDETQYGLIGSLANVTMSHTIAKDDVAMIMAAFKEVSSGTKYYQTNMGATTPSGGLVKKSLRTFVGSIASSATLLRLVRKAVLAGQMGLGGFLIKRTLTAKTGSIALSGNITKQILCMLASSIAPSATLFKTAVKKLSGALTSNASLTKLVLCLRADNISLVGVNYKRVAKSFIGAISSSGSLLAFQVVDKFLSGTVSFSGSLSTLRAILKFLSGTLNASSTLKRSVAKNLTSALSGAGTLYRKTAKSFSGTFSPSGTLNTTKRILCALIGTITAFGSVSRLICKSITGFLSLSSLLIKYGGVGYYQNLVGEISPAAQTTKRIVKKLAGSLSFLSLLLSIATKLGLTRKGSSSLDTRKGSSSLDTRKGSSSLDTRKGSSSLDR